MAEEGKTEEEVLAEAEALALQEIVDEEAAAEIKIEAEEEEAAWLTAADEAGPPKKGSFQTRIDELTRKRRGAERETEYWKKLALTKSDKGEGHLNDNPKPKPDKPVSNRPRPADFESVEEYEDALYGWYDSERTVKEGAKSEKAKFKTSLTAFQKKAAKLKTEYVDFDEVVAHPVFTDSMRKAIFGLDNGTLVAYELGKNPELAEKIKLLSPEKQLYEMSKLEHKLVMIRKVKATSNTPNPLKPLGSGHGKLEKDPDKMSTEEWMIWDNNKRMVKLRKKLGIE